MLYETKQYDFEEKIRSFEERNRALEEKLQKAREENEKAVDNSSETRVTAAEIDNETLTAQLRHLQNKINHLEEEMDEVRAQAESDGEALKAKVTKAREAERVAAGNVSSLKTDMKKLNDQAGVARDRIAEVEGALKENQAVLETARADIEGLRGDASVSSWLSICSRL